MEYESTILKRLIDTYGVVGNPHYISEIIKEFIVRGKERFPELFTYQSDWLAHIDEFGLTPEYTVSYTGQHIYAPNTKEKPVKSAILKGCTSYRDIDTGEILETFEEGRNLELVSVRMPVLTTSNEDGTKSNILTVNEEVELRGVGDVKDELDCLTGELTERIGEIVLDGSENWLMYGGHFYIHNENVKHSPICISNWLIGRTGLISGKDQIGVSLNNGVIRVNLDGVNDNVETLKDRLKQNPLIIQYPLATPVVKTVDLNILDQNGQNVKQLMSFSGGTHINTGSLEGSPLPSVSVSVETDLEETLMVCSLDGNTI